MYFALSARRGATLRRNWTFNQSINLSPSLSLSLPLPLSISPHRVQCAGREQVAASCLTGLSRPEQPRRTCIGFLSSLRPRMHEFEYSGRLIIVIFYRWWLFSLSIKGSSVASTFDYNSNIDMEGDTLLGFQLVSFNFLTIKVCARVRAPSNG